MTAGEEELARLAGWRDDVRERVAADKALRARYPFARDFLDAVGDYWGHDGHRTAADGVTHCAACPACRSKSIPRDAGWSRFPLVVGDADKPGHWAMFPSCGCSPSAIVRELLTAKRGRLDAELAGLEAA